MGNPFGLAWNAAKGAVGGANDWAKDNVPYLRDAEAYAGLNNAGAPYDAAAKGAAGMGAQAQGFSNTQWDRQQQGLGRALGMYDPAQAQFAATYGNSGSAMQNWMNSYGGQFQDQSQSQRAGNDYNWYMNNNPGQSMNAQGQAMGYIGQPSQGGNQYQSAQFNLGNGSQAGTQFGNYSGAFNGAGAGENWYGANQGAMNGYTPQASNVYQNFSSQLYGPSRSESLQVQGPSNLQDFAGQAGSMVGPGVTNQGAGEIGNYARSANDVSRLASQQMPQLNQAGTFENYVNQDINGTNPALERETTQGLAHIDQEMAKRGAFNSGAASTSVGNFLGDMGAKDYANRANLAQQAQGMQMQRMGQAQGLAQASAQGKLAQGNALQSLEGQQDQSNLGRAGFQLNAQQAASGENLAGSDLQLKAAGQADQSKNTRLTTLQGMANQADQGHLANQQFNRDSAMQAQQAQMQRMQQGMGASNMVDQTNLGQQQALYNMAHGQDQDSLARANQIFNMGQGVDQSTLARYGLQGQLANQQDSQSLARLMGMGNMAGNVDDQQQNWLKAQMGMSGGMAGLVGGFYNTGAEQSGKSYEDYINAMLNSYQLKAQGDAARDQAPWDRLKTGLQVLKAAGGGGGAG